MYPLACPAWRGTGPTGVVKAREAAYCTFPHIHYFTDTIPLLGVLCTGVCITTETGSLRLPVWLCPQASRRLAACLRTSPASGMAAVTSPGLVPTRPPPILQWGCLGTGAMMLQGFQQPAWSAGQDRAGLGVYVRGMQRNNVNPCNQNIRVQVSTAHWGGPGVAADPRGRLQWWWCL